MNTEKAAGIAAGTIFAWLFLFVVLLGMWGCPRYNVWEQGLQGEAELRKAEANRQIAVLEAKAKLDAAASLSDAEVRRAEGVAKANQIIGDSLKGSEAYLHYLWINELAAAGHVIYVPTEANLPLLEATRLEQQ